MHFFYGARLILAFHKSEKKLFIVKIARYYYYLLQRFSHPILTSFNGVHLPHQRVLRVVVHQVDSFATLSENEDDDETV